MLTLVSYLLKRLGTIVPLMTMGQWNNSDLKDKYPHPTDPRYNTSLEISSARAELTHPHLAFRSRYFQVIGEESQMLLSPSLIYFFLK